MITKDEMMPLMLEACPSFRPQWDAFVEEWKDEEPELPLYPVFGDLVRHVIAMKVRGETDTFPQIFEVVERWQTDGEHWVREAAIVGFLESLQNPALHATTHPEDFVSYLQPNSAISWDQLKRFWDGDFLALRGP